MTFVGKILTVLIFVMSLVFSSMALMVLSSNKNWREDAIAKKGEIEILSSKITALEGEKNVYLNTLKMERASRQSTVAALDTTAALLDTKFARKEAELSKMTKEYGKAQTDLKQKSDMLASVTAEVKDLKTNIKNAQQVRDEKLQEAVELADQIAASEGTLRILKERESQLAIQNAKMQMVMTAKGLTPNSLTDHIAPLIDGFITAVSAKNPDFSEISIGSDDGLRKGHQLQILRGKIYLGRAVVVETAPNSSVIKVELRKGIIKKNDIVTTKLN